MDGEVIRTLKREEIEGKFQDLPELTDPEILRKGIVISVARAGVLEQCSTLTGIVGKLNYNPKRWNMSGGDYHDRVISREALQDLDIAFPST
jgi:hypothetical protein